MHGLRGEGGGLVEEEVEVEVGGNGGGQEPPQNREKQEHPIQEMVDKTPQMTNSMTGVTKRLGSDALRKGTGSLSG